MANGRLQGVLRHIRKVVAAETNGALPDRELLDRFARTRDEAAFAALVHRHGAMVFAVCRRVLHHAHDAEDACQAVFLVLARKAGSIRKKDSLASWLHGVAYRAASNLKRGILRRQAREAAAAEPVCAEVSDVSWREVKALVDEELRRLPETYRAPLILCYLEGKTRDEAARELGWGAGTVKARLERGRDMLRGRLTRRGLSLSAVLLAGVLADEAAAALPALHVVRIVKAGLLLASGGTPSVGLVSARAIASMEGVLQAMFAAKVKIVSAVFLTASLAGFGLFLQAGGMLSADQLRDDDIPAAGAGLRQADPQPVKKQIDEAALAAYKAQSRNNLKQLALAMHNYHDTHNSFPPPAIYSKRMINPGMPGGRGRMGPGGGMRPPGLPGGPGGAGGGGLPGGFQPPGSKTPGVLPGPGSAPPGGFPDSGGPGAGPPGGQAPGSPAGGPVQPGTQQTPGTGPPGGGGGAFPQGPGASGPRPGGGGGGPGFPAGPMAGAGPMMPPGGNIVSAGGQALLSWRVALLPYLGEIDLYKQFRLNESWDSPHNLKLLKKMPKVFAPPGIKTQTPHSTFYQVFVGPHAAFEKGRALPLWAFTDGTSNTILIIEAGCAVPWTKPTDLHYAADEPLPELGGMFPEVMHAAFADGAVHTLLKNCDKTMLGRAIVRDDGHVLDLSKLQRPYFRSVSGLQTEKQQLTEELRAERDRLQELRRQLADLKARADAAGTEALRRENQRLHDELAETRREAERLRDQIERLRQALPQK